MMRALWLLIGWAAAAAAQPPSGRHYAPERAADILHLALDVTPDFRQRTIAAQASLRFRALVQPLRELRLDAVDLAVQGVTATTTLAGWQAADDQLILHFEPPLPPNSDASVTLRYTAAPKRGLYFRTPELGYRAEDTHLFTQGQAIDARHWFPCFDAPNEKFTSEVTCRVPGGMVVRSNGRLVSQEQDPATGLVAVRWLQDKPHVAYLIALVAGYFKHIEDRYRDVPLAFFTPASQVALAPRSFQDTRQMLAFFEQEIGVSYPWAKYDQVCVQDFVAGGMENTSLTILTDQTLHPPEFEELRSSQGLVAHELAHQWFGDLVTCKDWANLWLNEGFATYYELLYDGQARGRDTFLYRLHESARHILAQADQTNAIVRRNYRSPDEMFGYQAYPKGAWVLHMLRSQLGEELFRRCIQTFVQRHAYGLVATEDLRAVIEELSGRGFDQFFDQWVYHAAQPELAVAYAWDEQTKLARLTVRQTQTLSRDVLLFHFPLPLRFKTPAGTVDRVVQVQRQTEDFFLPLPGRPSVVRLDPDLTVLAKVNFSPPPDLLQAQLADADDMLGRLLAVEQLGDRGDRLAVPALKEVLNRDAFWGVRVAAAKALRAIHTEEAREALAASLHQPDARVRRQVVAELSGFYHETVCRTLLQLLSREMNPDIQAEAIRALSPYSTPEVQDLLRRELASDSFQSVRAGAAIAAMRAQDDARFIEPLLEQLRARTNNFPANVFAQGLDALAWLGRHQTNKDNVREFLIAQLHSHRARVQLAAITALGTLGDPKAAAVLETFAGSSRQNRQRAAAEQALARLRETPAAPTELSALRKELADLKNENRQLRADLDALQRKLAAQAPSAKPSPARKPLKADRR